MGSTEYRTDHTQVDKLRKEIKERSGQMNSIYQNMQKERIRAQQRSQKKDRQMMKMLSDQLNASNEQRNLIQKQRMEQQKILQQQSMKTLETLNNQMLQLQQQNYELMSREPQVIFQPDPKLEKDLQDMKKANKQQLKQISKLKDPQKMAQAREMQLKNYLEYLGSKSWSEDLTNSFGIKHNIVVGEISSGKSSCLNYYLDLNEPVGVDEITMQARMVKKGNDVCIWDSPGINEDFDLMDLTTLKLFATAHRVFLLFQKSLKCCKNDARILAAVRKNQNLYCIRTMCDKFEDDKQLQKALSTDRDLLKKWGLENIPVYAISTQKGLTFTDNQTVKQLLQN